MPLSLNFTFCGDLAPKSWAHSDLVTSFLTHDSLNDTQIYHSLFSHSKIYQHCIPSFIHLDLQAISFYLSHSVQTSLIIQLELISTGIQSLSNLEEKLLPNLVFFYFNAGPFVWNLSVTFFLKDRIDLTTNLNFNLSAYYSKEMNVIPMFKLIPDTLECGFK